MDSDNISNDTAEFPFCCSNSECIHPSSAMSPLSSSVKPGNISLILLRGSLSVSVFIGEAALTVIAETIVRAVVKAMIFFNIFFIFPSFRRIFPYPAFRIEWHFLPILSIK